MDRDRVVAVSEREDDLWAALRLGASMAQVGTAYLCCPETTTSLLLRRTLMSDAARHTAQLNEPTDPAHFGGYAL